jgi:hypothetical protein
MAKTPEGRDATGTATPGAPRRRARRIAQGEKRLREPMEVAG